jgi:hypothetical protein
MATNKNTWLAVGLAVALCLIVLLFARRHEARTLLRSPHYLIVVDPSESSGAGCRSVRSIAHHILEEGRAERDSDVTLLATGDQSTANEPRRLGLVQIPTSQRVIEGRVGFAIKLEEFEANLEKLCLEAAPTKTSPIFLGAKRGADQLRGLGCVNSSGCEMYVATDGEENAERQIQAALNIEKVDDLSLPEPIDNAAVEVTICGLSETVGTTTGNGQLRGLSRAHDNKRVNRIQVVWSRLFTHPEQLRFIPFCTN